MRLAALLVSLLASFPALACQGKGALCSPLGVVNVFSTWNSAVNPTFSTYSNGNNTWACSGCTGPNNTSNTRGTQSRASGQYYFEMTVTDDSNTCCYQGGLSTAALGANDALGDNTNNGVGYGVAGAVQINNVTITTIATYTNANVIGVAVDLSAHRIWFRVGTGNWNNNATFSPVVGSQSGGIDISGISSGTLFPGISTFGGNGTTILNTGGSAFTGTLPTGYLKWN